METRADVCRRIASLGGSAKSEKKAQAARENARKPRPNRSISNALRRAENKLNKS